MWLLVQYIDSEFPDYDIVNKTRLLKIKYGSKNIKLVRAESDHSLHRAVVIQESEHEYKLKIMKDILLKEHREKRTGKKGWSKRNKSIDVAKKNRRVFYSSSDSDSERDSGVRGTSENSHDIKNEIANSMSCSSINEAVSSEDSIPFSGSPKVEYAATSTPYPLDSNTSYHTEADREVQAGPDRVARNIEKIVSAGVPVQREISNVLKMFEEFSTKFSEEQNESVHNTSMKDRTSMNDTSPEIRRSRRRIIEPKFLQNSSLDSPKTSDKMCQKKILLESAENVRQNILKVLAMCNELDSYPEAHMYKAKYEEVMNIEQREPDLTEVEESDTQ